MQLTGHLQVHIMPATVTHIGGVTDAVVVGTAVGHDSLLGKPYVTGPAFASEVDVRAWIESRRIAIVEALKEVPVVGRPLQIKTPDYRLPHNGDIVYILDDPSREVREVQVGMVTLQDCRIKVAYDPGHPESSMIHIESWYPNKEVAMQVAFKKYGADTAFVTRENLSARASKENQSSWAIIMRDSKAVGRG
jgi:hypothetical protein